MFEGSLSFSFNQIQILRVFLNSNKTFDYKRRNFRKGFKSKDRKKVRNNQKSKYTCRDSTFC